jgi:hypothetical protein
MATIGRFQTFLEKKREEKLEKANLKKVEPDNDQLLRGSPRMGGKNE